MVGGGVSCCIEVHRMRWRSVPSTTATCAGCWGHVFCKPFVCKCLSFGTTQHHPSMHLIPHTFDGCRFVQIVLALYHVHSKNILHRDLVWNPSSTVTCHRLVRCALPTVSSLGGSGGMAGPAWVSGCWGLGAGVWVDRPLLFFCCFSAASWVHVGVRAQVLSSTSLLLLPCARRNHKTSSYPKVLDLGAWAGAGILASTMPSSIEH